MTLEEMKRRKKELGLSNKEIAARSGVPLGTVQKIFGGITLTPRMETILALEKILRDQNGLSEPLSVYKTGSSWNQGKKQGEYTLEDYYALPDERRVELIDGVIYDMAAPSEIHQLLLGELFVRLSNFIRDNKGKCRAFAAPFDVQLDMDQKTMVQPDILVICDRDKVNKRGVYGAPDFVIEILSPSTSLKDHSVKLLKYMRAGVREYWIVDYDSKQIMVYRNLEETIILQIYTFDDQVPVGIWEDKCRIDFREIMQDAEEWLK